MRDRGFGRFVHLEAGVAEHAHFGHVDAFQLDLRRNTDAAGQRTGDLEHDRS